MSPVVVAPRERYGGRLDAIRLTRVHILVADCAVKDSVRRDASERRRRRSA